MSQPIRYGMVIDLKRCIGCDTCTIACKAANATPRGISLSQVLKYETGTYPKARINYLPVICNHCEHPACLDACPTGATAKRNDGIVTIDQDKCIGCKYCMIACPYTARRYFHKLITYYPGHITPFEQIGYKKHIRNAVQKCDFCLERVEKGQQPSCVVSCTATARFFGNLNDPASEVSRLIKERHAFTLSPEMATEPSVYYLPAEQAKEQDR